MKISSHGNSVGKKKNEPVFWSFLRRPNNTKIDFTQREFNHDILNVVPKFKSPLCLDFL